MTETLDETTGEFADSIEDLQEAVGEARSELARLRETVALLDAELGAAYVVAGRQSVLIERMRADLAARGAPGASA